VTYAIDPELAAILPLIPQSSSDDIAVARLALRDQLMSLAKPDETGVTMIETRVPGPSGAPDVRLLVYRPEAGGAGMPAVYDVHGGGFVMGEPEMNHAANLQLCRDLGGVVVSVDYRLAPEHPYPAGLDDCYAGLCWLDEHADELGVDRGRIAVHGASAGGGLGAALAMVARDRGGPAIAFCYLGIPELDDRLATPSMEAFVDTPIWTRPDAEASWDAYLGTGRRGTDDVPMYAAPARAGVDELRGLPPTYVSVMEFDPLRDEGIAYALALLDAGVHVELHLFRGTFHGSAMVTSATVSRRDFAERRAVLCHALGVPVPRRRNS